MRAFVFLSPYETELGLRDILWTKLRKKISGFGMSRFGGSGSAKHGSK